MMYLVIHEGNAIGSCGTVSRMRPLHTAEDVQTLPKTPGGLWL